MNRKAHHSHAHFLEVHPVLLVDDQVLVYWQYSIPLAPWVARKHGRRIHHQWIARMIEPQW